MYPTSSVDFETTWQGESTTHHVRYEALAASTATTFEYVGMTNVILCGGAWESATIGGAAAAGPADCGLYDVPDHFFPNQSGNNFVLTGPYGTMTVTLGGTRTAFAMMRLLTQLKLYAYWNTGTRAAGDVDEVTYTRTFVPAP